jgi:tRNA(adenine34) deaminase
MTTDHQAMGLALDEAATAPASGDVPVGAVVLDADGVVVGRGHNLREADGDPFAHAEVVALRDAARTLGGWRLDGATLVVTLEPCTMCAGALLAARVGRLVYGAWDAKAGAVGSVLDVVRDRRPATGVEVVAGLRADESAELLRRFFAERRTAGAPGVTPSRG